MAFKIHDCCNSLFARLNIRVAERRNLPYLAFSSLCLHRSLTKRPQRLRSSPHSSAKMTIIEFVLEKIISGTLKVYAVNLPHHLITIYSLITAIIHFDFYVLKFVLLLKPMNFTNLPCHLLDENRTLSLVSLSFSC